MENAEFIRHALKDDSGMIAGMMGMHAQFTISDETMELAAANKPDEVGYHIHVAEGIEDLHHCLKHYGKRIVDRLMDFNILGEKTLLGHCIYINPHEMDLIKDTNTMVVHNPEPIWEMPADALRQWNLYTEESLQDLEQMDIHMI